MLIRKGQFVPLLLCGGMLVSVAYAGPPTKKSAATKQSAAMKSLDLNQTTLPAHYPGSSIVDVLREAIVQPKGEFETTAEFEARKTKVRLAGLKAFRIADADAEYDADTQKMTVTLRTPKSVDFEEDRSVLVNAKILKEATYKASNALGGTREVKETSLIRYLVTDGTFEDSDELRMAISVARADAPKLKNGIRVFAVCDFDGSQVPETLSGFFHNEPTFSAPREDTIMDSGLKAKSIAIWIVDDASGNVLQKFDSHGHATMISLLPAK